MIKTIMRQTLKHTARFSLGEIQYAKLDFFRVHRYKLNLELPDTLSAKIRWIQLYGKLERFAKYADMNNIREMVRERIGEPYLTSAFGTSDPGKQLSSMEAISESKSYKLFCYHGEPYYIQVDDEQGRLHYRDLYDFEWNKIPVKYEYNNFQQPVAKPLMLDNMIQLARLLSKDFPFVRVDLHGTDTTITFSKLTFTPGNGKDRFSSFHFDQLLGRPLRIEEYHVDRTQIDAEQTALDRKQNILIYRDHLLAPSETFIKSQGEGFQSFHSYFVGSRCIQGLDIEKDRKMIINGGAFIGRMQEIAFKLTGYNGGLTKRLSLLKPRLLHAHFGPDGVLAMPLAHKLAIPLVVTFHGYDVTTKDEYAKKSYYTHRHYLRKRKELQQKGSLFIAVSDFIKRKLIQQGYPPDKVIRHYIGVDTRAFQPDPTVERRPIVLFVGRLVEVKGCAYLIQAMEVVQKANPEAELVIIGDGPLRNELERMAAEKLNRYRFMGVQPHAEVKKWMNRARVFCVPSITAKSGAEEGLGMVFLEASSMGLPIVSFATGGIPEAVKHQATGFLTKERNWQALAEYIVRLLKDDRLWQSFSVYGQKRTQEMFDLHQQTLKLESIYQSLLMRLESSQAFTSYSYSLS